MLFFKVHHSFPRALGTQEEDCACICLKKKRHASLQYNYDIFIFYIVPKSVLFLLKLLDI